MEGAQFVLSHVPIENNFQTENFHLEYEGNDYLRPKVFVDDDIVQEKPSAGLDIIDLGFDFYLAKFEEKEDMLRIVSDGPYIVGAASAVGTPFKVDRQTSMATRGRFARVCVKLNLEQSLIPKVFIGEVVVSVTIGVENASVSKDMMMVDVEDNVVVKVDKGSVGPGKRISNVLSISSTKVPVLPVIDNVSGRVVAKFVSNEPKPPDLIASDVIVCKKPMVISKALANKVNYAMNEVVSLEIDDDISDDKGDCNGCYWSRSPPRKW
ncbi:hypothetical protein K2173_004219 [Erythroxylum novogranatense]|uniref:Uncharacterized protein n=1 Tax=Erythroxylum novogranatense TaxID=1862640 RepID=A0AAV8UAX4_9ROSI|nr:hypothetical protein K2173_004219 [Erythroxylum novogranatense]